MEKILIVFGQEVDVEEEKNLINSFRSIFKIREMFPRSMKAWKWRSGGFN